MGRRRLLAALGVLLVGGVGGAGMAAAFTETDVISGCVASRTGDLRIVDAATACTSKEHAISWNQQGIQGPTGPPALVKHEGTDVTFAIGAGENFTRSVTCPSTDTSVLTGGYDIDPGGVIYGSRPTQREWIVNGTNPTDHDVQIFINVFCAIISDSI